MNNCRVWVRKKRTGALWSSANPSSGVWVKEFCGSKVTNTQRVGSICIGFHPLTRPKHKGKFALLGMKVDTRTDFEVVS